MLLFIDQPKQIRIVRTAVEDGVNSRAPIGRIMKASLEVSEDLRKELSKEELSEIESLIVTCKEAEQVRRRNCALQLPAIVREAMDYFEEDASGIERQLIMTALVEALRRMRKFERTGLEGQV